MVASFPSQAWKASYRVFHLERLSYSLLLSSKHIILYLISFNNPLCCNNWLNVYYFQDFETHGDTGQVTLVLLWDMQLCHQERTFFHRQFLAKTLVLRVISWIASAIERHLSLCKDLGFVGHSVSKDLGDWARKPQPFHLTRNNSSCNMEQPQSTCSSGQDLVSLLYTFTSPSVQPYFLPLPWVTLNLKVLPNNHLAALPTTLS